MPSKNGNLSKTDLKKVQKWINTHPPGGMICPFCQGKSFGVHMQLMSPMPVNADRFAQRAPGPELSLTPAPPLVLVDCKGCGLTYHIDASAMGLVAAPA
jgi:hypothetical protein